MVLFTLSLKSGASSFSTFYIFTKQGTLPCNINISLLTSCCNRIASWILFRITLNLWTSPGRIDLMIFDLPIHEHSTSLHWFRCVYISLSNNYIFRVEVLHVFHYIISEFLVFFNATVIFLYSVFVTITYN